VLAAVEQRRDGPKVRPSGHYLKPWDDVAVTRVPVLERPPLSEIRAGADPIGGVRELLAG
jgi:hypothetical protein